MKMLSLLSDDELLARIKALAHEERRTTASLIAHLAELDERKLYLGEGYSSLFQYCIEVLHLSEQAAYRRIQVARIAGKYPVLLEKLSDGSLNLTTVLLLAPHLNPENHLELLEAARHKSKMEVEELVARVRPLPAVPSSIRKLPETGGRNGEMKPGEPALEGFLGESGAFELTLPRPTTETIPG